MGTKGYRCELVTLCKKISVRLESGEFELVRISTRL